MISFINTRFKKSYSKLPPSIKIIAKKQYKLFKKDPYHTSLHFKKVHSSQPIYSARITKNFRTIGVINDGVIIWFWIGDHEAYDKILKKL